MNRYLDELKRKEQRLHRELGRTQKEIRQLEEPQWQPEQPEDFEPVEERSFAEAWA